MELDASVVWDFAGELVGTLTQRKGSTLATVTRIDPDGTTWVTTDGEGEAPAVDVAAGVAVGDTVALEWDGSTMGIRANVSDPAPTGAMVRHAQGIANAARKVADAVNQHFFADTHGIHVTEATQEEWESQQSGPNVLINSLGQLFRDGMNNLLSLLPAQQTQTDTFTGDGTTIDFTLSDTPTSVTSVTVGGTATTDYVLGGDMLTFYTAPESGAEVVVTYRTSETAIAIWDGLGNDSANVVALFAANLIEIGRNSASAVISFCNGTGYLRYDTINGFMLSTEDGTGGSTPTAGVSVGADTTGARARMSASSTGTSRNWSRIECRSGPNGKYIKMDAPGLMLANNGLTSDGTYVTMRKVIELFTEDISWTNLQLSSTVAIFGGASYTPKYCRRHGIVDLVGEVSPKNAVASGGTLIIGTLPSGCRPIERTTVVCQGSGGREWVLTASTDGTLDASRYRAGDTYEAMSTSSWLPFHLTFVAAES